MINLNTSTPNIGNTQIFTSSIKDEEKYNEVKEKLDNADLVVISKLYTLKNTLSAPSLNMSSIKRQIDELATFNKVENYDYLCNLLRPEKARGSKLPSQIPVPSCCFQLRNSITLTTNASGNAAFFMNPFFLASENVLGEQIAAGGTNYFVRNFLSSAWINNAGSLTGNASDANWTPVNFGQTIPAVYEQYRLVSAALVVRYIGRLDQVKGEIGGAIFYDDTISMGGQYSATADGATTNTVAEDLDKYGFFDYAQDAFYSKTNMTLEGIRMLYFPIDNSYEEFVKLTDSATLEGASTDAGVSFVAEKGYYKGGFNWFFWAQGCPEGTACFKLDIYCNFECLPAAKFLNYMPITVNPVYIPFEEMKKLIMFIQAKPIMKSNEDIGEEVIVPSIFLRLIKKFKNGLPCLERLKTWGLMNAVPGLTSGLALAGSMLQSQMQVDNCY